MKHWYALSDWYADTAKEPSFGFANTKVPIAFKSKEEREEWINKTNFLGAKPITRAEAEKMAYWHDGEKLVDVHSKTGCMSFDDEWVVVATSKSKKYRG